jgi:hypothetical protein
MKLLGYGNQFKLFNFDIIKTCYFVMYFDVFVYCDVYKNISGEL